MMRARSGGVQSVERSLDILEALGGTDRGMGITEIGRAVDLPYATIHRLVATLAGRGYVRQDPETRKYVLGSRLVALGSVAGHTLSGLARPFLRQVVEMTGETANLAVLEDGYVVYVAQAASTKMVRMFTEVGNRVLPHRTAVGKVLLARLPRAEAIRILQRNGLPSATARSITDLDRLVTELEATERRGYGLDIEEQEEGVCCIAVPVAGVRTGLVAALSVSGPSSRISHETHQAVAERLQSVAQLMGATFDTDALSPHAR